MKPEGRKIMPINLKVSYAKQSGVNNQNPLEYKHDKSLLREIETKQDVSGKTI